MNRSQPQRGDCSGLSEHTDGYRAIADLISSDPDGETYIFRKFAKLTARKLLYPESELIELD